MGTSKNKINTKLLESIEHMTLVEFESERRSESGCFCKIYNWDFFVIYHSESSHILPIQLCTIIEVFMEGALICSDRCDQLLSTAYS